MPKFRLSHALAAAGLLSAVPAAAEVTQSGEGGFVSRHEVVVAASPKEVWLALISPSGWWTSDHTWSGDAANLTLTPQAGGCFCEKIPEVDEPGRFTLEGSVEHMRVIQAYPERALRMVGALGPLQSEPVNGVLTIAISEVEAGTRIVWEYNVGGQMRYEVPVIARAVDAVMGLQLAGLAKPLGPVAAPAPAAATTDGLVSEETLVSTAEDAEAKVEAETEAGAKAATKAPAKPPAEPLAPAAKAPVKPAPAPAPAAAAPKIEAKPPAATPTVKPAATAVTPKPAVTPVPAPAAKPAPKAPSVDEAFSDFKDEPSR